MALILLGADNKVLQEGIQQKLQAFVVFIFLYKNKQTKKYYREKKEPCESKLYDFDNVSYQLVVDKDDRTRMSVSLQCPNWSVLKSQGSEDWIKQKLGEYIKTSTADGMDFEIPLSDENDDKKKKNYKETIGKAFSKLRVYALGGPLYQYCKALDEKKALKEVFEVKFRPDTYMWICPGGDRLTIVYALEFPTRSDRVIANQVLNVKRKSINISTFIKVVGSEEIKLSIKKKK
ncbi:hypothetical protein RFI_15017 [Reticulomyxa filosa]|uniref:Arp2/3 complex 34 kDa subunit n=1 Tax=Reticulomyxa filosa TaxID=46433 RepID=X6N7Z2_RETFI|nr:hypothetical protein RFI_15017 [Reticulomyxa filosa]|eukprot:ETO22186.1 hypothetical protein RFI_15017 [Reticulomyxa filosa]